MLTIKLSTKKPRAFERRMEQFLAYVEHFGIICGGGWDMKKKTAEFYLEPHTKACMQGCCTALPIIKRITPEMKASINTWLDTHGFEGEWTR